MFTGILTIIFIGSQIAVKIISIVCIFSEKDCIKVNNLNYNLVSVDDWFG